MVALKPFMITALYYIHTDKIEFLIYPDVCNTNSSNITKQRLSAPETQLALRKLKGHPMFKHVIQRFSDTFGHKAAVKNAQRGLARMAENRKTKLCASVHGWASNTTKN